jgi:hypothetical protein
VCIQGLCVATASLEAHFEVLAVQLLNSVAYI